MVGGYIGIQINSPNLPSPSLSLPLLPPTDMPKVERTWQIQMVDFTFRETAMLEIERKRRNKKKTENGRNNGRKEWN
jgi:hypothetical protein